MARRLKKYVIPSMIGSLGAVMLVGVPLYIYNSKPVDSGYKYTMSEEKSDINDYIPVLNEIEENKPIKPFLEETVTKSKDYYQSKDDVETQQNSIIYYDKTYMPNTGILYSSDENFDVVAPMDGTVKKIGEDNILGKYVELEHTNGYKSTYYSLSETSVTEGAAVTKGDVIGISGANKLDGISTSNILFETYHDGLLMDPEDFYNINFSEKN